MITGFVLQPDPAIHACLLQTFGQDWIQQQMINAQPTVALGMPPEVIPERVDTAPRSMNLQQAIGPALRKQAGILLT